MILTSEMARCPFCGHQQNTKGREMDEVDRWFARDRHGGTHVKCECCKAAGPRGGNRTTAMILWNSSAWKEA